MSETSTRLQQLEAERVKHVALIWLLTGVLRDFEAFAASGKGFAYPPGSLQIIRDSITASATVCSEATA